LLGLAVVDKDDILERLFDLKGVGFRLAADFQQGKRSDLSAGIVGFARHTSGFTLALAGNAFGVGTPTDWLPGLSSF
jgi:hypothetical protein